MTVHVARPLPVTPAEMLEREAFYRAAADRVNEVAKEVVDAGGGFGGRKAFIAEVAERLRMSVARLAPKLVAWHRLGWVELVRADLAGAMDPGMVAASEIDDGIGRYTFVVVPWKRNPLDLAPIDDLARSGRDDDSPAVELYRTFHRLEPRKLGAFDRRFKIPTRVRRLGDATCVLYRSSKVDPATLRRPKRPQNYIHEHDAGVACYDTLGRPDTEVPAWIGEVNELVLLGDCLGFAWRDAVSEVEAQVEAPLPELYAIPSGKALLVVEEKRKVAAIVWGGALDVEARGIVG